jgi:ROS/MUCR transcriptional regulator protein
LKRHLATLGMTPDQYRAKWNLPADYPMVAPNYAAARSALAKNMGLGQKRRKRGWPPRSPVVCVAMRSPGVDKESAQMDFAAPGFQGDGALKIVQRAEDTFNRGGVDAILNRYAEDVIPIRGSSGNPGKGVGGKIPSRPIRAAK